MSGDLHATAKPSLWAKAKELWNLPLGVRWFTIMFVMLVGSGVARNLGGWAGFLVYSAVVLAIFAVCDWWRSR